jgi:ParB-like chromosome segregation protein Spo0J
MNDITQTNPVGAILAVTETLGINQRQLAERLGIGKAYLTDIKSGRKPLNDRLFENLRSLSNLDSQSTPAPSILDGRLDLDATHYQCMPDMQPDEFDRLVESIREKGLLTPIVVDEGGKVLDGHHRVKAAREAGIDDIPYVMRSGLAEAKKLTYAAVVNIERRHLGAEQKRDLVARLLESDPAQSDRQVAKATGTSPTTVGKVRAETGTTTTTRTGRDGRTLDTSSIGTKPKDGAASYPKHEPRPEPPKPPKPRKPRKPRKQNAVVSAQQAMHLLSGALHEVRNRSEQLSDTDVFRLTCSLRDSMLFFRERIKTKDWDAMLEKLCREDGRDE